MKTKPGIIAQKLLNLYRQQHVILGGWTVVNQIFVNEADASVLAELKTMPTGQMLVQHIENLRNRKTPMDSVAIDLLPYGGMIGSPIARNDLSGPEIEELRVALANFVPDLNGLSRIQSSGVVRKFGAEWQVAIQSALANYPELQNQWGIVIKTARAYQLWQSANDILSTPISDRTRAQVQADLPEFETYLPMFGDTGNDILSKLRVFVSSV